ncbi:RNA-directed DNA polymerase, eukaryota, reverse transcriptase zinc-binding domain protein [Tanacetum coccineum]
MDATSIEICHSGKGKMGFTRVLIEVNASKGFKKKLKLYIGMLRKRKPLLNMLLLNTLGSLHYAKHVEYLDTMTIHAKTDKAYMKKKKHDIVGSDAENRNTVNDNKGFVDVQYKKKVINPRNNTQDKGIQNQNEVGEENSMDIEAIKMAPKPNEKEKSKEKVKWSVKDDILQSMKRSANKYFVLEVVSKQDNVELNILKGRIEVDKYLTKRQHPPLFVYDNWSHDMLRYFKEKWEEYDPVLKPLGAGYGSQIVCIARKDAELLLAGMMLILGEHTMGGSSLTVDMKEFNDCVNRIKVDDLCSSDLFFTWTKNPKAIIPSVMKKLDRIMVNEQFIQEYSGAHAIFLPYLTSDHSAGILNIPKKASKKKKSFRLANYICDKEEFIPIVDQERKKEVMGCHMYKSVKKLKMLKPILNTLNWKNGNLFNKVVKLRDIVKDKQRLLDKDPHNGNLKNDMVKTLNKYQDAMLDEEKLLYQKAKIEWLKEGDHRTAFFHKVIKGRMDKSRSETVCNDKGEAVVEDFVKHFNAFLGNNHTVSPIEDSAYLFSKKLTEEEASWMIREVSDNEIKDAMFNIGDHKAPSPDVGEVNATVISLVPKIPTPNKVTYYRPIVCCNVMYKCISKILTNRIKDALNKLVNKNQSAFIPDRWIMTCISSPSFTINVNGDKCGFFKGARGLRQGDPISPYLFTLIMEVFTLMMERKIKQNPDFKYHKGCKDFIITHLCFVDDLVVKCHGDKRSVEVIKAALDEFSNSAGLLLNPSKSTIFFSNVGNSEKAKNLSVMPFSVGSLLVRYLGVPLKTKRLGVKQCKSLIDKIEKKVKDWKNRWLSFASRLQLISSVLSSIQGDLTNGKAKIAWSEVCKPKAVGGLDIKDLNL